MLFFELFSLNLSRLFHCSVIKVLCPAVLRDNFYILSQLSAFVNRFFHIFRIFSSLPEIRPFPLILSATELHLSAEIRLAHLSLHADGYTAFARTLRSKPDLSTDSPRPAYLSALCFSARIGQAPMFLSLQWVHGYSRRSAAFPAGWRVAYPCNTVCWNEN